MRNPDYLAYEIRCCVEADQLDDAWTVPLNGSMMVRSPN